MRIVVAPNALKGSLSALNAAVAIGRGALRAAPAAAIQSLPIADGGDGTSAILVAACSGNTQSFRVHDPLGREVDAELGLLGACRAVVDVASASGLARLNVAERDPMRASSYGTGQLLLAALETGCRELSLGVGGSATVDGGLGILSALGFELLDAHGAKVVACGEGLARLARIAAVAVPPALAEARLEILCDVGNPLLGPTGAARVFAEQKGASAAQIERLELGLARLADVIERDFGRDVRSLPFGGAAGGIAAGLNGVLGAELVSGIERVLDSLGFEQALEGASLVISAEGRFDRQSLWNKGPIGVARRAHARGVPTLLLAGSVESCLKPSEFPELHRVHAISEGLPEEEAMARAAELLERAAERAVRDFLAT